MLYFIVGLIIFFAIHMVRSVAPQWRDARIASMGELKWKALYSILSLAGFMLLIRGFAQIRPDVPILFTPPVWAPHLASALMAIAFIFMVAAYAPTGRIKQAVKHPFLLAIKIWAFAHLLANGDLASAILFGSFLAYSVWDRIAVKRRGAPNPVGTSVIGDFLAVVLGLAFWALFVFWAHEWLFGVNPIA
ncbi:MAG: NnrU family protein [Rhizobiaceae bacterium]|nr:NnrU family protein [Rhizobiaceae bacterium]